MQSHIKFNQFNINVKCNLISPIIICINNTITFIHRPIVENSSSVCCCSSCSLERFLSMLYRLFSTNGRGRDSRHIKHNKKVPTIGEDMVPTTGTNGAFSKNYHHIFMCEHFEPTKVKYNIYYILFRSIDLTKKCCNNSLDHIDFYTQTNI